MNHSDFVPLHVHSEYSLLDGAIKIPELMEAAAAHRMPAGYRKGDGCSGRAAQRQCVIYSLKNFQDVLLGLTAVVSLVSLLQRLRVSAMADGTAREDGNNARQAGYRQLFDQA